MSKKTVLMIAPLFPPNAAAGAHRTDRFVRYLRDFGWEVIVITKTVPLAAETQFSVPGEMRIPGLEHLEIIRIDDDRQGHTPGAAPRLAAESQLPSDSQPRSVPRESKVVAMGKSLLRPIWQFIEQTPDLERGWSRKAAGAAIERCRQGGVDVVYSTGPPHSVHLAVRHVAQKMGLPFVADFRDPWARNSWIRKRNPIGRRLTPWLERMVVRSATKVIANNAGSLASFVAAYPALAKSGRFVTITNGFDPEIEVAGHVVARRDATPITAVHAGSLYVQRDPRPLIEAIAQLAKSGTNIEFHHIGSYDAAFDPVKIAGEVGCEASVRWLGELSHGETLSRLSRADLLVVIQPNAPFQIPGKVFEMLLFDQPIVAVCDSAPTEEVIRQAGGTTAASNDIDGIAQALQSAVAMRGSAELTTQRQAARLRYNGRELTKLLASVLDESIKAGG
ncbi:glycosyltransferase [Allorhodopirellula heiligendammensis]|uniref:Glycosyl transferases group 1 n=1 Tax=Allorhodopirellula heiligendammensis TaxID=2714739 RepID=A0A5C6C982_9BACT|nr:glycosyltransferase [Allorhodopirellula heiligendammensis]TWU20001.1 Glycosyl transferases group 1 [Allorhodopirellula heiligendammensis]